MSLSDADLLDIVRRLRLYMSTIDNVHQALNLAQDMDDEKIVKEIKSLIIDIPSLNLRVSGVLRNIENTRAYRDMLRKFSARHNEDEEEYL